MADLLGSSSDEDEAPASAGVWRSARVPRGSAIAAEDSAATDLLIHAVAKPADGSSRPINNPLFKPVISARELLKQFLPAKAKASMPTNSSPRVRSYLDSSTAKPTVSPSRLVERKDNRAPSAQAKASLTVSTNVQREEAPATVSSVYISPFGHENDPQLKRRRQSLPPALASISWKAQREDSKWRRQSLSNGSTTNKANVEAKPTSVNAISVVVDNDDDWFSDANEKEASKTEQAQAKEPSRPSLIEQPRLQAQPSRKRQRPRSDSESSLPDEERWPRLPPRDVRIVVEKITRFVADH